MSLRLSRFAAAASSSRRLPGATERTNGALPEIHSFCCAEAPPAGRSKSGPLTANTPAQSYAAIATAAADRSFSLLAMRAAKRTEAVGSFLTVYQKRGVRRLVSTGRLMGDSLSLYPEPQLGDVVVEDNDYGHVSYRPVEAWSPWASTLYHGAFYHTTNVSGASVVFSFTGSYVAYYSDRHSDHGSFNVSVDNGAAVELGSYSVDAQAVENQLLFSAVLPYGAHTLTVKNVEEGKIVGVDYFVYRPFPATLTAPSPTAGVTESISPSPEPLPVHAGFGLDPAAAVGIALGAIAGALLLGICVVAIYKHRARIRRNTAYPHWQVQQWRSQCR